MTHTEFKITENDTGRRLDRVIRKMLPTLPLSKIYSHIRKGYIRVSGVKCTPGQILKPTDIIQIESSINVTGSSQLLSGNRALTPARKSEINSLNRLIVYKDVDFLVLNKPAGAVVHGKNSLNSSVKKYYHAVQSLSFSVGALHRLDAGTSGLLVFSQSLAGAKAFSKELRDGNILRYYKALICGRFTGSCDVNSAIEGKPAATRITAVRYLPHLDCSLAEIQIFTGRKHQIRIHCSELGFPLYGDGKFNTKKSAARPTGYFLCFYRMVFPNKILQLPSELTCELPAEFQKMLAQ